MLMTMADGPATQASGGGRKIPPFPPVTTAADENDEGRTNIWRTLPKLPASIRN
jgi:hypothetical protein